MTDKVNALATAKPKNPRFQTGNTTRTVEFSADFTGADSAAGDTVVLATGLSLADRISGVRANSTSIPALTGATDTDLGFYYKDEKGLLVALGADVLWDGVSMASAFTGVNALSGKNASLDQSLNIGELLSLGVDKEPHGGVYLVMTLNNANTATATVALAIDIDCATTN
tara:strand:- start:9777 stop:10286 length:510 start_codon:yes stop_codon:yes gene_type:complete